MNTNDKKHFLMLKQHQETGLKYLCYHYGSQSNCFKYTGSGKRWTAHLKKHGYKISTIIIDSKDTKEELAEIGIKYSKLWDVVNSEEFANLIEEDCNTTSEPLQRLEVRLKRNEALKKRIKEEGLTEKEISTREKGVKAMQKPEVRAQAARSLKEAWQDPEKNKKFKEAAERRSERISRGEYTEAEIAAYKKCSERQKGKTMKDRLGDDYVDPRLGKKTGKSSWSKGKKMTEIYGEDYIDPKSKPFSITSHLGTFYYKSESDFIKQTNFSGPNLSKLKQAGEYTIKRQKNTRHPYAHGEIIHLKYSTLP